ncbi:MAG TPA: tetratricopeptide repeat protein [Vicinamibacterales bacterium]|jgi:TolA-binding protein|nr:tetratricopeptide repeat protein [Vicinamibacterales bacterium]
MKRTERHHLKENELERIALQARETVEARRREIIAAAVVLAVVGAAAIGYFVWHDRVESKAHALLAEALAVQEVRVGPPAAPGTPNPTASFPTERDRAQAALAKFKGAADSYPSTDAGIYARYEVAVTEMMLGDPAAAAAAYQTVVQRSGSSIYGQMARLGLAEAQARSGQYDQAIDTFKELSQRKDGPLPVDGILMQLGRTYLDAGKRAEAQQTFTRLVEEYPDSPFNGDAKKELDGLKKT